MMDDDRLQRLLRSAFTPTVCQGPSRDLWPLVVERVQAKVGPSWLDISLAGVVTLALLMFPQSLLLLAYHL